MSALLSLPNELLDHIINDLHIDDIEAFSSCCKQFNLLAAARLEKHLRRKFNFQTITIEPTKGREGEFRGGILADPSTDLIPIRLLRDFLMDEENTLYPRLMSIIIGGVDTIHYNYNEKIRSLVATYLEQHHGLENKIIAKVMQIHESLDWAQPAVEAQDWIDCINRGDHDATAALLVTLFPNVKTLRMRDCHSYRTGTLMRTLESLASAAAKNEPRALSAFSELSEFELEGPSDRRNHNDGAYGKLIAMFMILPSMQVIKGCRVYWRVGDLPSGPFTSSVKEISLQSSEIESKHFMACLERIKTLERLTYNLVQTRGTSILWEPRLLVKALRKYARKTLVHLDLTGDVSRLSDNPAEPFIGTLRSFQVLKSVRLMSMMLFKPVDGADIEESEDISKGSWELVVDPYPLVEPRRLVDVLPYSARKLELRGGLSNEEARDMFADLPELKRERVPKLSEIVLEDNDPLEQETKYLCKYAGIRLKSFARVRHRYQRIYVVTKPAPQADSLER